MIDVVRWRAARQPRDLAFTFLRDGPLDAEHQTSQYTFGSLDRRARAIAAELQRRGAAGERALVILEPGLDYLAALFGCFYAGVVAVPVYPPDPFRIARTLPRLQAIFGSADCKLLFSTAEILGQGSSPLRQMCPGGVVEIETIVDTQTDDWTPKNTAPSDLALLQYTSGTTGEPRGVPITHANLLENLRGMERLLDVQDAVGLFWLPPYHDLGLIGGVFLPLFAGRHMMLMSPLDFMRSPARWLKAISHYQVTSSAAPNFGYEHCLKKVTDADCEGLDLSSWQVAVSGAEPVRAETLDRFCERFAPYGFRREAFVPAYGMAETTLMVSIPPLEAPPTELQLDTDALTQSRVVPQRGGRRVIGCGPPGPGVEMWIVDPETRRPTDGVGEVWVRGDSVASGYWGRTELTASQFDQTLGGRRGYFRTGDLGFLYEGELFLVGRRKEMIILAGRNYYPHDIELAVQQADDAFKRDGGAAVAVDPGVLADGDEGERLVLFQEVQRPKKQDIAALLTTARRVATEETGQEPLRVVLIPVGELPKTSSGKTRRAECWEQYQAGVLSVLAEWPASGAALEAREFEAPANDTEAWLARCWGDLLDVAEVGRGDSFFALGGRSLQVTEMLTQVAQRTGLVIPLAALFDHPTLAELATYIDEQPDEAQATATISRPLDLSQPQPLSASQERFWLVEQLGVPGGANVPVALRLDKRLKLKRLEAALNGLIARHDALRCGFSGEGADVVWQIRQSDQSHRDQSDAEFIEIQQGVFPVGDKESACAEQSIDAVMQDDEVWRPFDLAQPPLVRAKLFDLASGEQILLLVFHHLVCDGGSVGVLLRDLAGLYAGETLPPATKPQAGGRSTSDAYWADRLAPVPAAIELPLHNCAAKAQPDIVAARLPLDAFLVSEIDKLVAGQGVTPFLIYIAAFQLTLSRYSGQATIGVGTAVANRPATAREAVGCFINTVPFFAEIDDALPFDCWLQTLQRNLLADLDHSATPWEEIVLAADKPRVPGRMPLVQTFFVHDDRPLAAPTIGAARVVDAATDYRGLGVFDLALVAETCRPQPGLKLIHNAWHFPARMAEQFLAAYTEVLQAVIATPTIRLAEVPVLTAAQRKRLERGGEPTGYPAKRDAPQNVAQMFAEQAERSPTARAVTCGDDSLTFAELDGVSTTIATNLAAQGVRAGDRVGLLLHRSIDLPAAILGVWKVGAAYVPLDPSYPAARLEMVVADAELACVLADDALELQAPAGAKLIPLSSVLKKRTGALNAPQDGALAYVMYTSGSTGKPKGVMVPHRAVANLLQSFAHDSRLGSGDAMLGATTFGFDISVLELFLPLVTGAELVLADTDTAGDASRLMQLLEKQPVTHLQGTPSWFRMLRSAGWRPTERQTVLCGGEEVPPDLAAELIQTAGEVWNVYGPTETTIWSTLYRVEKIAGPLPIGKPIAQTRCYILDAAGRLAPPGVWGELVIAGAGVAEGYWNRPELTAERFPSDPYSKVSGARMYRTGDTARWNGKGELQFGGRRDGQVKVRGHRVELREVELALTSHGAVKEAAVLVRNAGDGAAALVAYVSPANGQAHPAAAISPAELLEHLGQRLPGYMAPSAFIELPQLPKTANGKIDRNSLPQVGAARTTALVPPRSPLEERLAEWVRELLRIDEVGVFDNFFEIGGQSLLATQLVVRIRDELGAEPPLREVYGRPTIAAWAELILRDQLSGGEDLPPDLLERLESMTDEEAAAFLESLHK